MHKRAFGVFKEQKEGQCDWNTQNGVMSLVKLERGTAWDPVGPRKP